MKLITHLGEIRITENVDTQRVIQEIGSQVTRSFEGGMFAVANSRTSAASPHRILLYVGKDVTVTLVMIAGADGRTFNVFCTVTCASEKNEDG